MCFKLSVVVPVYNCEKYLYQCITSLVEQSYNNTEIIIVNDGSTDDSLQIAQYFEKRHKNIKVVNKNNEGVMSARYEGYRIAEGEYITFVDADDYVDKNIYNFAIKKIISTNSKALYWMDYTVRRSELEDGVMSSKDALAELCKLKFPTSMWAGVYKKDLISKTYFYKDVHFFEDFLFQYRFLSANFNVYLSKERPYNYRVNSGSVNRKFFNAKRMSCMKIVDYLENDEEFNNDTVIHLYPCCIAHFIYCNLIFLYDSVDNQKLEDVLKKYVDKYWCKVILSNEVVIKQKIVILFAHISFYFTKSLIASYNKLR